MPTTIHPFLMFTGQAAQAMNLYTSLFEDGEILSIQKYGPEGPGAEGTVMHATFRIAGQTVACIDSPPVHEFTFTPATSLWITCETEAELDRIYAALSEGGQVLMPLDRYPFSEKYAWFNDRFGVSWQISLPR